MMSGKQKVVRDLQDLYPETDQREVEDEEHDIADIHARDRAPEERGMLD